MLRLRFYDLRLSRLPDRLGLCQGDIGQLAGYINSANERLITCKEAGDHGWWGSWAEIGFTVSRTTPYITMPREVARLEMVNVCNYPVPLNNQFFEYLQFGDGRMPQLNRNLNTVKLTQVMERNNAITFYNLESTPQILRIYSTDSLDYDGIHRVLIQGEDASGNIIYSQDGLKRVTGIFVTLESPFVDTPFPISKLTGIQKDVTAGQVQFFQVDPSTGAQLPLHTMEPSETTALYRRYYFSDLPCNCCLNSQLPQTTVQVTALAKLELIPVKVDTDYTLIQSQEAIINECEAIRYEGMDKAEAHAMADRKHKRAIGILNGQLAHYYGQDNASVQFSPFGSAKLERQGIGIMI